MVDFPQPDSKIFSIRIVSVDYYMAPPISGLDISYSSFQGGNVNEVPVIRIYGSTPAGQKTCLHIHKALPYLYVPCSDLLLEPDQEVSLYFLGGCTHAICLAMEKALKLKGNDATKRQHVHSCSLVRAKKFYGYHSSEELFVKIYLYYPQDVSRASNLLLLFCLEVAYTGRELVQGGAVLDKILQPHESHIPFLLQFLVDHNLYGMGHIHVSKIKFRDPVPEIFSVRKDASNGAWREGTDHPTGIAANAKADFNGGSCLASPIWTSSTIPDDWIWQSHSQSDPLTNQDLPLIKRQSISELEGDAVVEDILNQLFMSYTPLSQTCSDVKMVQSLISIWEEEIERSGIQGPAVSLDPEKPSPEDVLKKLSLGLELEQLLVDVIEFAQNSAFSQQSINPLTYQGSLPDHGTAKDNNTKEAYKCTETSDRLGQPSSGILSSLNNNDKTPCEGQDSHLQQLPVDQLKVPASSIPANVKASDQNALRLLNWLASSQAAEEINSDDELACETILSPFLPATTIDEVLERANMNFENQSQQECQDILDSVEDVGNTEGSDGRVASNSDDRNLSLDTSFCRTIPQVDGSADDPSSIVSGGKSSNVNRGCGTSSEVHSELDGLKSISDRKRKGRQWGSLPFSSSPNANNKSNPHIVNMVDGYDRKTEDNMEKSFMEKNMADNCPPFVLDNVDRDYDNTEEATTLVGCSMRELMRKKRCHRIEQPESRALQVMEDLSRGEQAKDYFLRLGPRTDEQTSTPLASPMSKPALTDEIVLHCGSKMCPALEEYSEVIEMDLNKSDCSRYVKYPFLALGTNISTDGLPYSSERINFEAENVGNTAFQSYGTSGSSKFLEQCEKAPHFLVLENHEATVCVKHDKSINDKSDVSCCNKFPLVNAASSCHSNVLEGETLDKDGLIIKYGCKSRISEEEKPEISDVKFQGTGLSTGVTLVPSDIHIDRHHERNAMTPGLCSSIDRSINTRENPMELIGMTFFQKPPVMDWIDELGRSSQLSTFRKRDHPEANEKDGASLQDATLDDILPFFRRDHLEEQEVENARCSSGNYRDKQEAVMGVPVHYQNDGSYLYMLTPILSPPLREYIERWLFEGRDSSTKDSEVATSVPISPRHPSEDLVESHGSPTQGYDSFVLELSSRSHLDSNLDELDQRTVKEVEPHHVEKVTIQRKEGISLKPEPSIGCSQEMSQLSGPDVKSKLTPLSQIGFRDPASVGRQQLTIMSIEVQAESRGDLRPDPRFDAVNMIAVVAQEDDGSASDALILLHSSTDTFKENLDGISECKVLIFPEENHLFCHFATIVCSLDPDILMGWDIQGGSLGFLAERAAHLGIGLLNNLSRVPSQKSIASKAFNTSGKEMPNDMVSTEVTANSVPLEDAIIEDEWGRTHASGVHVGGRIVLNVWRLMRSEVKLNMYSIEVVAEAVLRKKIPSIPCKVLREWFSSGPSRARYRCMEYILGRAKLNLQIMNQLDMINRTSELARVFGIDFFSVLSRGSQYRVESMFLRLAHTQNYVAISPGSLQVASQPAMECLPLVMEPESGFCADPVVVLDFQSLYPSMIIAYNLCFCTCLGKIIPSKENTLGVSSYSPDMKALRSLNDGILITPNSVMYVPSKVRKGVLPRLLEEILSTRVMVKQAMKKLDTSQQVLYRIFNARQLALKLIANVTYGYTAAGFSGRMPCAELADSIVQCGRRTLENAISFVNNHDQWKAKVIYGDTDSMFVLLKGRNRKEAFQIGNEIAAAISAMNPKPVILKMEKVYHPCFLLTKKRYVGYSYETPDQSKPKFDAKGIETIRRDTCGVVSKTMEQSLKLFFEHQDIFKVKAYLLRQWRRIISGRISLQDFVFAKEVRLGTYSARASSLPPAAIVASKAMKSDPRAEPRYAERIPYVVVHGEPGARLVDMVVDPQDLLAIDSPYRLNDVYYITKQIIPALQRVFGLVGADLNKWFSDLPRPEREAACKRHSFASTSHRTRIDFYYLSKHCILCGALVQGSAYLCHDCSRNEMTVATALTGRTAKLEKDIQHLAAICRHCGGGDWIIESGVKCTSLACSIYYERRKVQKELKSLSALANEVGFYPKCMAEWF